MEKELNRDQKTTELTSQGTPVRIRPKTQILLRKLLVQANQKDLGNKIKRDDLLHLGLSLIQCGHISDLQNRSLNNADRMELLYREYVKNHGPISKDAFLGRVMSGEIAAQETSQSGDEINRNSN